MLKNWIQRWRAGRRAISYALKVVILKVAFVNLHYLSNVRQFSMGVHLRMMNESFFSIHGVPESIKISKKPLCQNFHLFSSFKIFSNFMPYSRDVRSTLHGLLYTKPNLSLWGFTMPKGFGIGQHIREKPGTSKFTLTFGHPVFTPL